MVHGQAASEFGSTIMFSFPRIFKGFQKVANSIVPIATLSVHSEVYLGGEGNIRNSS